jgi:nucleotidyltransferase substrate binding protein (TIGR01987 family)
MLELSGFRKAIDSLKESMRWYEKENCDTPLDILRDSVIQRFEYTYELAWKMMKRWLEANLSATEVDGVARRELFRIAAQQQLVTDPLEWFKYHQARNMTSHIYDEATAEQVFSVISSFIDDVEHFFMEIEKRNG